MTADFDPAYLGRKLQSIAETAKHDIALVIRDVRSEAALAGAHGGSRERLEIQKVLKKGFLKGIRNMSRVIIDVGANKSTPVRDLLEQTARNLASDLIATHATPMFGHPAFDQNAEEAHTEGKAKVGRELEEEIQMVTEDTRHGIVGDVKHYPTDHSTHISGENVVVGGAGAIIQQGRDNLTQAIQEWDPLPLVEIVNEAIQALASGKIQVGEADLVRSQLVALNELLKAKTPDKSVIRSMGGYVGKLLNSAVAGVTAAAASGLGHRLIALLPQ